MVFKPKRSRSGLHLARKKNTSYTIRKNKIIFTPGRSPFRKKRHLDSPFSKQTPSKSARKKLTSFHTFSPRLDSSEYATDNQQLYFKMPPEILLDLECSILDDDDLAFSPSKDTYSRQPDDTHSDSCSNFPDATDTVQFQDTSETTIASLLPSVIAELKCSGQLDILEKFFRLVSERQFPVQNIAYLLWCDVINFLTCSDTRQMRYNPECMKFFWVGKKFFGGRFMRFMSGMKNETDILQGKKILDPKNARINFACPSEAILTNFKPLEGDLPTKYKPGILKPMIKLKGEKEDGNNSYVLMLDGKKIKRGTDVDLLGFENGRTLKDKIDERDQRLETLQDSIDSVTKFQAESNVLNESTEYVKRNLCAKLICLVFLFSTVLREMRSIKVSKSCGLNKLKDLGGVDWRKSKYAFAIDTTITSLWKIDNVIDKCKTVLKCLCKAGAHANNVAHLFATSDAIKLNCQQNFEMLKQPDELPSEYRNDKAFIKQRSDDWFRERSKAKVTGSTIFQAIGCDSLKRQKEHFDKVINGISPSEPSETQRIAMQHGSDCEVHQIATMCGMIMPLLYPDLTFREEGFYHPNAIVVSPDGSLRSEDGSVRFAFEGKAPTEKTFTTTVHYKVPDRYITQTVFEQKVLNADGTLYMSWTDETCTLFKVLPNDDLCSKIESEVEKMYQGDTPKRPSRLSNTSKEIKTDITNFAKQCIFLGEFPSVQGYVQENHKNESESNSPFLNHQPRPVKESVFLYDELQRHLILGQEILKDAYEIQRVMASQVVVYLLSDLDRLWKDEQPHAIPVLFFYRGYSMSMDIVRQITEECKAACRAEGLDVVACAADGEFTSVIVRGRNGNPLTQHQLSKNVWKEVCKMTKSQIIQELVNHTKEVVSVTELVSTANDSKRKRVYHAQSKDGSLERIRTPNRGWSKPKGKGDASDVIRDSSVDMTVQKDALTIEELEPLNEAVVDEAMEIHLEAQSEEADVTADEMKQTKETDKQNGEEDEEPEIRMRKAEAQKEKEVSMNSMPVEIEAEDVESEEEVVKLQASNDIDDRTEHEDTLGARLNSEEMLNTLKQINNKKWSTKAKQDLKQFFVSAKSLKRFTIKELIGVTKVVSEAYPERCNLQGIHKLKKHELVNQLSGLLGDGSKLEATIRKKRHVECLSKLSQRVVMGKSYPKKVLSVAYSNFLWPDKLKNWKMEASVSDTINIHGVCDQFQPYYVPDKSVNNDFEVFVYDKTHLGSNLRKCICLDKVCGVSKDAWTRVAETNPTVLNPTLLDVSDEGKIVDQMKESFARNLVSDDVEQMMVYNGDLKEAKFCGIVREGLYEADDSPGVPAIDRCRKRMELIAWLSEDVDFGQFPPFGMTIKGLSVTLYEGLRSSSEAKLYLYALSKKGTYNVRAPNTLCSESFFSTMQEMDPWGQGVLSSDGVEKHISDFTTITAMKMMEDRTFYMKTKRDAAYPVPTASSVSGLTGQEESLPSCNCRKEGFIRCIVPKDHFFDSEARARLKRTYKPVHFSDSNQPQRGEQPIRQRYGYKMDESKILLSKRLGLKLY